MDKASIIANRIVPALALALIGLLAFGGQFGFRASELDDSTDPMDTSLPARKALIKLVRRDVAEILREAAEPPAGERVFEAMRALPRHRFVPAELVPYAYLNRPLPVGWGQTVSQPTIVALMTALADIQPGDKVLTVGIGGGYHTALVARLAGAVSVIALLEPVADAARKRFAELKIPNVEIELGDGYYGWSARGPYDAIIVRQAVDHIPPALLRQLKTGGHLVMPVGPPERVQHLMKISKQADGAIRERRILPVRFTTMPGGSRI